MACTEERIRAQFREGSFVFQADSGHTFDRGTLVIWDQDYNNLSHCPDDLVSRELGQVALISEEGTFVTWRTSQFEAVVADGLELETGDRVVLANTFLVEEKANDAENLADSMGLDTGEDTFSVENVKYDPSDLEDQNTTFGGYEKERLEAQDFVRRALSPSNLYRGTNVQPPHGLLILGPPGTGKTTLAKHLALEVEATLYLLRGPEVLSKWVGESEKNLKEVFRDARESAPSIIFIDEIDGLAMSRGEALQEYNKQLVATLLSLMDGFRPMEETAVIGTTNRTEDVDLAFRRAGRLDQEIELLKPTLEDRTEILSVLFNDRAPDSSQLESLARRTDGWVGSDLYQLVRSTLDMAAYDDRVEVWQSDIQDGFRIAREHRNRRQKNRRESLKGDR